MVEVEVLAVLEGIVGEEGKERLLVPTCDCELLSMFIFLTTLFLIILIGGTMRSVVDLLLVGIVISVQRSTYATLPWY